MTTPAQYVTDLYNRLNPAADIAHDQYILTRTPADLQALMVAEIASHVVPPLTPLQAIVNNDQIIPLQDAFTNVLGTVKAKIAGGVFSAAIQQLLANLAMINEGGAVVVHSLADANLPGSPGVAHVTGSALTKINLTV